MLLQRIDPIPYVCFDNAREKNVYLNCELSPLFVFCEFCELESQKSLEWRKFTLLSTALGSGPYILAVSYSAAIFSQFTVLFLPSTDLQILLPVI